MFWNNFKYKNLIYLLVVIFIGCYAFFKISRPIIVSFAHFILRSEQSTDNDFVPREVTVEAEKVVSSVMPKHISTVGELKANKVIVIRAEMASRIKEVLFKEGSLVTKGDLLIRLDDAQAQADLRARKAKMEAAQAELTRYERMKKGGISSDREYEKALAELNIARSEVEMSEAQLRKTEIRAEFDGTIGLMLLDVGASVQPNQDLVALVDSTPIKVKFGVPGKFINDVGAGQKVIVKVDACKDTEFIGFVDAVDSIVDASTNSISVKASVPNEDGLLKAGLFAKVTLITGEQGETITVDESAIERMGEQEYVWLVERKKAKRAGILTGSRFNGRIEVVAGLKSGQVVVTAGQLKLTESAWVKITNMNEDEQKTDEVEKTDSSDD